MTNSQNNPNLLKLPEIYQWLCDFKYSVDEKMTPDSHLIVLVKEDLNKPCGWVLESESKLINEASLQAQSLKLGWKPAAGLISFYEESNLFTLVPLRESSATFVQKVMQAGMDLAFYLKERSQRQLTFLGGKNNTSLDLFFGFVQGMYSFTALRQVKLDSFNYKISFLSPASIDKQVVKKYVSQLRAQILTRFISDTPANHMIPEQLAAVANEVVLKNKNASIAIEGRKELAAYGMGSFLSVAQGALSDPKLVTIKIRSAKKDAKTIVLIGKGVTFDSGGLCLKPGTGMPEMKYDMCGAASLIGVCEYLADQTVDANIILILGCVENLLGSTATRPGDVVKAYDGKTIEVLNTDAEGRLVLADLLSYAEKTFKPDYMIDIATLTGAIVIALGPFGAALYSNNQEFANQVLDSAKNASEPLWQMPIWAEAKRELKSEAADLANIGPAASKAGSVLAAAFLNEFVSKTKWAHLDIAGTAWNCKATGYPQKGASAYGLRTLIQFCESIK